MGALVWNTLTGIIVCNGSISYFKTTLVKTIFTPQQFNSHLLNINNWTNNNFTYIYTNLCILALNVYQGWGQVQLTKYSSTPSTPNIYQVQVLVKY